MEQFNIIGVLEQYAISQGWHFVYRFDNFHANIETSNDYTDGKYILCADFRALPVFSGMNVKEIRYECLLMLGRKYDLDGLSSTLDETPKQKYDRRLKELCQLLAMTMITVACSNQLDIEPGPITVDINVFDTNIDFAISENTIFTQ